MALMKMFLDAGFGVRALGVVCVHPAGVLLFDRAQGFWLSHSIPHFPSFPERGYLYPSSGKVNGQTALCVTYHYSQFLSIGERTCMRQQGWTVLYTWQTAACKILYLLKSKKTFAQRLVLCQSIHA